MIPLFKVRMSPDATARVAEVLQSGYIGQGPRVEEFEANLAQCLRHPHPVTVNSATSGLTLALRLIVDQCGTTGEVLAPPLTCTATNWPILATGNRIRWVDTNPADANMDMDDLRRQISSETIAIILVHWGGYPNDLDAVGAVQQECFERFGRRPAVIEDCAHALGSLYGGKPLGSHGNFCVYSFQAIKQMTCGDGGVLLCPASNQAAKARLLRWYGIDRTQTDNFRCEADIQHWGYKFHMNDINAAIGLENLKLLPDTLDRHRDNARFYNKALLGVDGVTLLREAPDRSSSYWLFTIRARRRDDLQAKLFERGIAAGRVHERNDRYSCTRPFRDRELPGTDTICSQMLCIPVGWWVSQRDREFIVDVIKEGW